MVVQKPPTTRGQANLWPGPQAEIR